MDDLERAIQKAIANNDIPGCVLEATNRDGSFRYSKAFGTRSFSEPTTQLPLQFDTVMWIASCTKLMTSICALQLVEQNKLNLDDPVYEKIPELKDFPVLKGFSTDDGSPIEAPHTQPITLRSLLVHTSGFSYESIHPLQMQWLQFHGREVGMAGTVLERYSAPMVFQPGSSWMYGPSLDFVGLLIERVTGQTLESYMRVNLWEKLGIKDMTFFISKNEGMKSRFAEMANRDAATGKISKHQGYVPWADETGLKETEGCMGGHGVFATLEEYIKVLHAVLTCDDDEKILRKETLELLFSPQLGPASKATMNGFLQSDFANNAMGGTPMDIEKDHGLGGLLLGGDTPSGMKAGTLIWGGLPNLTWFIDRKSGLCGLYAGQVLPTGDTKIADLNRSFQKALYEQHYAHSGSATAQL